MSNFSLYFFLYAIMISDKTAKIAIRFEIIEHIRHL